MTPRQHAKSQGLTRFFGNVCAKHPKLKGERLVSKGSCIGCQRERQREPGYRAKYNARQRKPENRAKRRKYRKAPEYRAKFNKRRNERRRMSR
jgi:hypothetical protein